MFYSAFRSVYKNNIIFKLACGGDLGRSTDIHVDMNAKFLSSKQHRRDINNDGSRYFEFGLYPFVLDKHQYSVLQTMYS
jgi:hypothetical protein